MTDLEAEREQKQRDFDRKLLLAKSKIETEEASVTGRFGSGRPAGRELSGVNKLGLEVWRPGGSSSGSHAKGLYGHRQEHFPPLSSFLSEN